MSPVLDKPFVSTWSLTEALHMHNQLVPIAKAVGFGVGLTGGILRNCHSDHDVDVIFYQLQAPQGDIAELKGALKGFGMTCHTSRDELVAGWRARGSQDEKFVEVWQHEGKRVDIFFLR